MTLLGMDQATAEVDATVALVAQPPSTPNEDPGGRGEDFGKSSPVGLLVILLFAVAVIVLVRSMTKHLKRVPESFDPPEPDGDDQGDDQGDDRKASAENGDADSAKS
ncbi:hypothetical protein [Actinophytocola sediminis]